MIRIFVVLAAGILFPGCQDWRENAQLPPDLPPHDLTEQWRIDGNDAALGTVPWLIVTPAGDLVTGQPLDGRVLVFDSAGTVTGAVGSRGRGRGQFINLTRAGTLGDSVWIYDSLLRRVTVLAPDRQVARTFEWPPPGFGREEGGGAPLSLPYLWAITPTGDIVHSVYRPGRTFGSPADTTLRRQAAELGRTVIVAEPEPIGVVYAEGFALTDTHLFPIEPIFSPSTDGQSFVYLEVTVDGPEAGTFRVTRLGFDGYTIFSRRHGFYPVPIPPDVAEAAIESRVQRLARRELASPGISAAFREVVTVSPVYPPVEEVVVGGDGSTWIRMRPLVAEDSEYYILDAAGQLVGHASLPGSVRIAAATLGKAWGIDTDEMGVGSIVAYLVSPARPTE